MCFSASVSFGAAALLVPAGAYSLWLAKDTARPFWMIAIVPLMFGIQQGIEGGVWLAIGSSSSLETHTRALMFLLFSHYLWLLWIPFSSSRLENDSRRKKAFTALALLGGLGGSSIYLPLLLFPGWLTVEAAQHSIVYTVNMPHDIYLPTGVDRALYGAIVLLPLLLSSHRHLQVFGVLVTLSMLLSAEVFNYAFVSVWCFFAALLSIYIITMMRHCSPIQE